MTIRITGVADNFRTPGGYAEILFAQGPAAAALGARTAVFVGPKLTAGTATTNTIYRVNSSDEMALLTGSGSDPHRMARKYFAYGSVPALYAVAYTPTGGTAASLSLAVTAGGSNPSKRGQIDVQVTDSICSYGFTTNDTASSICDGAVAAINGKTWLPVTAAAYSTGTGTGITITDKTATAAHNTSIRVRTDVTSGAGVTVDSGADLSGGVGDDAAPLTTALAVLDNVRHYYVGVPAADATLGALVETHVNAKSQPLPGLRSVGILAGRGTLTATTTIANGINHERIQYGWQEDGDNDIPELVGELAGLRSLRENTDSAAPMAGTALRLNKAYDEADWPTPDEQSTAINEGIAPIASNDSGAYLVMSVDTRSKNPVGTVNDFRATETHRVSVADDYMDTVLTTWNLNFAGKKFKDDKKLADGSVDPNQILNPDTVQPSMIRKMMAQVLRQFEADQKLQNVDASVEGLLVQKSTVNAGRAESQVQLHTIDHHHQLVVLGKEVSNA
jgi:phage tail sheath gpL-like